MTETGMATFTRSRRMARRAGLLLVVFCVGLAGVELACRVLGLHSPILYERTAYGYRVVPNQSMRRLGNRIFVNEFGMRSETVAALSPADTLRILCIGDSIANGGATTDQADTYPYQLEALLRAGGRKVQVLNASAAGWAIANEAGWLESQGTFGADLIIETIGSLDMFQELAAGATVDGHPSFPSRAPTLGMQDLFNHYLMPRIHSAMADPGAEMFDMPAETAQKNLALLLEMKRFTQAHGARFAVLLVEQPDGYESQDPRNAAAKQALFAMLEENAIPFAVSRESVQKNGGERLFRDGVHPTPDGYRILAQLAAAMVADAPIGARGATP
ncbi:MAG: SGNH/GDSL hydrolase family protein [Betaproteobacteria bacterium]